MVPASTTTVATILIAVPRATGAPRGTPGRPDTPLIPASVARRGADSTAFRWPPAACGDLVEIAAEHLHAARRLSPVEVLVDRVITVLGERQPQEDHRRLQEPLHRQHRADRAPFAHEGRLL